MTRKLPTIKSLYVDHVLTTPVYMDYSEFSYEDQDNGQYRVIEAARCSECNAILVSAGGVDQARHSDFDFKSRCEGSVTISGPAMSFFYPCEWKNEEEAAKAIVDLPLCLVELGGQKGLALTGGGMDLSWEICEAYIRLGFNPPLHFAARLGSSAGMELTPKTRAILAAAKNTAQVVATQAKRASKHLTRLRKDIKEDAERRMANRAVDNP